MWGKTSLPLVPGNASLSNMNIGSSFNRRKFLTAVPAALAASYASTQANPSIPDPARKTLKNPIVYRFEIGDIEAFSISDGTLRFGSPAVMMYPEDQRPLMKTVLEQEVEPTDYIPCYINVLVLRWGKEVAVIDPGFGPDSRPRFGWLADGLAQIGITPGQVTASFLSHAHIDHIGGLVTGGKPAFPNAAMYVLQTELDFWFGKDPDFSQSHRSPGELPRLIKGNREKFEILKPQTQTVKDGVVLFDGRITISAAPGHTAGHAVFRIESKGQTLLHIADLVHHSILMFHDPNWIIGLDHHPAASVASRKRIFQKESGLKTRLFGFHLPWPGLGHVAQIGTGYRWLPESIRWENT